MLVPHVSSAVPKETQVVLFFFLWQEMSGVCSLQQFSPGECGKRECHSAPYSKRDNGSCCLHRIVHNELGAPLTAHATKKKSKKI